MAHGDYNCCAICDSKMDYNAYEAKTKEDMCEECLDKCKELNLNIKDVDDFKEYIKNASYTELKENLIKLNYEFCWYSNDLDKDIAYRFLPRISFKEYISRIEKD